jgi:hypothetical protein
MTKTTKQLVGFTNRIQYHAKELENSKIQPTYIYGKSQVVAQYINLLCRDQ